MVVVQLVERSLPTAELRGSNPAQKEMKASIDLSAKLACSWQTKNILLHVHGNIPYMFNLQGLKVGFYLGIEYLVSYKYWIEEKIKAQKMTSPKKF